MDTCPPRGALMVDHLLLFRSSIMSMSHTWKALAGLARCSHHVSRRTYSSIPEEARAKWRLQGVPAPRSILEDDDTPVDLSEDDDAVNGLRPGTAPIHKRKPPREPTPEPVALHKRTMKERFPDGWNPPRKLSREAMEGLRQLYRIDPVKFDTPTLAEKFKISPEAVRRILRSRWEPSKEKRVQALKAERRETDQYHTLRRLKERLETEKILQDKADVGGGWNGHSRDRLEFQAED